MKSSLGVKGLQEIDNQLAALPKATSKAVMRRALKKELEPVASTANFFWPGADDTAFAVSSRLKQGQRAQSASVGAVTMYVGATRSAPHAHLLEFGTEPRFHKSGKGVGAVSPTPILLPSWDSHKDEILAGLAKTLREELQATIRRRASRGL
ncbi:hypothetical protein [Epibacterium ulvae]|uniref:hypothetical protein n=1 Tax=Epibacterium ulvae TaxID=1156985 RepID=UPI0024925971|nr:hypothetical protein [Epibacterium ulvae]